MTSNVILTLGSVACLLGGELNSVEIIKQEKMAEGHELTKIKFDAHTYIYFVPNIESSANAKTLNLSGAVFMHDPGCSCHYNAKKGRKR